MLNPSPIDRHRRIIVLAALALLLAGAEVHAQPRYKDGEYTGDTVIEWGPISVKVVIQGGKITDVVFLKMPDDRPRSVEITEFVSPILKREAIAAQDAKVSLVSSATVSSVGFRVAMAAALNAARK
jgi:uncharacterized protein with FMN-binding domain